MLFHALGSTYNIHVKRGRIKTYLHGKQWQQFITKNYLRTRDMLVFTMTPHPTIFVPIGERGNSKYQTDDIEIDSDNYEDQIDADDKIVVAQ